MKYLNVIEIISVCMFPPISPLFSHHTICKQYNSTGEIIQKKIVKKLQVPILHHGSQI